MAAPQNFRTAFNGFNREDVVRYLEYINAKHTAEINQLTSDVDHLRAKLDAAEPQSDAIAALEAERDELKAQLEAMTARVAELEAAAPAIEPNAELEAYRRAERTERMAKERAELVYHQVNGVLAEASLKVEGVAGEIGCMANQVMRQLTQLQTAIASSEKALNDAVSTMYAIRPND